MSNKHCLSQRKYTIVNSFSYHLQSTLSVCNTSTDKSTSLHLIVTYNLQRLSPKNTYKSTTFSLLVDSTTQKLLKTHVGSNLAHPRNTLYNLFKFLHLVSQNFLPQDILHCTFSRTFWTRYLYDYVSNIGNYGWSESLILTVFQKVIFYSLPVVGLCMAGNNLKYFYTILLPLLEENFEKLSKTQKMPYLYQKVDNKRSEGTFLGQHFTTMIIFKKALFKSA